MTIDIITMNIKNHFKKITLLTLLLFLAADFSAGQTAKLPNPQQEKLLNGMNLLIWNAPSAEKATVRLRIHSGSAFDPQTKEGVMAVLSDILFPNQAAKEFFQEDLGGSLEVTSNYDYIQINATSDSDQLIRMLDTLAVAVTRPVIDKETTAGVIAARLEKIRAREKDPAYVADLAVARRLFGDFPYGRAIMGTSESVSKIDFADLILARQRFLTADNATLAVISDSKSDLVYRAVRRYFGSWEKSDKKVPATFRQPAAPEIKELSIETPAAGNDLKRMAMMAAARNDSDFYAAKILSEIWRKEFCFNDESKKGDLSFEPHLLRGTYIIRVNSSSAELPLSDRNPCSLMLQKDGKTVYPSISQEVFDQSKNKVLAELNQQTSSIADLADLWLDVDTYKLVSVKDEIQKANNVTLADVRRVAENLQKQPVVSVIVKKPAAAGQ